MTQDLVGLCLCVNLGRHVNIVENFREGQSMVLLVVDGELWLDPGR